MARVVCLCVDGSAAKGDVRKAVVDALGWNGIGLVTGQLKYSKSAAIKISKYREKVRDLIKNNGGDPSSMGLLIVGKSLGGAKMYRFIYKEIGILKQFAGVAVVLVDAHEPIVPGNKGKKGKWYNYVYFTRARHRLKWWQGKWGPHGDQASKKAKLRFHVIYQRNSVTRGYGMNTPYKSVCLTGRNVKSLSDNKIEKANHWNISWCDKTVDLMTEAIGYLKGC